MTSSCSCFTGDVAVAACECETADAGMRELLLCGTVLLFIVLAGRFLESAKSSVMAPCRDGLVTGALFAEGCISKGPDAQPALDLWGTPLIVIVRIFGATDSPSSHRPLTWVCVHPLLSDGR